MALEDFRLRFGKAMMELTGTAMLLLTIQLSVGSGTPLAPFTIGVVLIALVYAGFPISGAHYNPAVSLCIFLRGKMSLHEMIMYWIFQIGGGVLGALLGGVIGGNFTAITRGTDYYLLQAFLAEFVFTGLLCFVVLAVATTSKAEDNQYYAGKSNLLSFPDAGPLAPPAALPWNNANHGIYICRFQWLSASQSLPVPWPSVRSAVAHSTPPLPSAWALLSISGR